MSAPAASVLSVPTPAERNALLFVAALATLGVGARGVRALRTAPHAPEDRTALAMQIARVDSVVASGGRQRPARNAVARGAGGAGGAAGDAGDAAARATTASAAITRSTNARSADALDSLRRFPLDLDRATATELDRLPGIGPALAARIVADRDTHGPFGSVEGLQRVNGIGPALATRVQPYVTFALPPRPSDAASFVPPRARRP